MDVYKAAKESFSNFAETRATKLKGLKEVAALAVVAVAFAAGIQKENLSLWKLVIWCVVYLAYKLGRYLDTWLFDRLYGAECKRIAATEQLPLRVRLQRAYHAFIDLLPGARMLMYESRAEAARKLSAGNRTKWLYKTAEKLFSHTDAWDDEVKPLIVWSKAARTVAVLLVGLAVYGWYYPHDFPTLASGGRNFVIELFQWWPLPLILSVLALLVYLALRVRHVNVLYALIYKSNVRRFVCPDTSQGAKPEAFVEMIAVGHVVCPVDELPLLNPPNEGEAAASSSLG